MTRQQFEYKIKDLTAVPITEDYTLWRKPVSINDFKADKNIRFKTIAEALDYVLDDGRTVGDVIETWSDMPDDSLDAGPIWHIKGEE